MRRLPFLFDPSHPAIRKQALKLFHFDLSSISKLSLGLFAVTVTADGFNIMHASIADC
jgi:hypothetical protein